MRHTLLLAASLGLIAAPRPLAAQSRGDAAAYFAFVTTPVGALPPVLTAPMLNRRMTDIDVAARYGHIASTGSSANAFDARLGIPVDPSVVLGINAGYQ